VAENKPTPAAAWGVLGSAAGGRVFVLLKLNTASRGEFRATTKNLKETTQVDYEQLTFKSQEPTAVILEVPAASASLGR
jgi:hypothetical protein